MKTIPERETQPSSIPPLKHHRHWGRILLFGVLIVLLVAGAAAAAIYKVINEKIAHSHLNPHDTSNLNPVDPGGDQTFLILGSDTREGLNKKEQSLPAFYKTSGQRSDTIIVVHLYKDKKHAVVLSLPRDLRINVAGYGLAKVNSAYNLGPNNVIKTVHDYTGLDINHYIEVNFIAFRRIVDALGGVDVCVKHPYSDPDANFFVKRAGCYHFDGDEALGFARTRKQDPRGDFDRIDHQQQLIREMLSKTTSLGTLFQPQKVLSVADAVGKSLKTDKDVKVNLLYGLAQRLKGAEVSGGGANKNVDFRVVPSYPQYIGGVSYVVPKADEAKALFDAIKADKWPLPPYGKTTASIPQPKDVTVRVYDASGKAGAAQAIHEKLRKLGFDVKIIIKKSSVLLDKTQIWIRPGDDLKAQLVDEALTIGQVMTGSKAETDADVTIYVGADAASEPSPSPGG